jgi:transposase
VEAGLAAIEAVQARLESPKTRLKTKVAAETPAKAALADAGAARWVGFTVTESTDTTYRQESRGRPGSSTRYRRSDKPVFSIAAKVHADLVSYDAATDGCFPLITCDKELTPAAALAAYRYQPNLERRNHMLKGPQLVAPVFLESPHRIEALLLCHFVAMLAEALIEREIRASMRAEELAGIPLYPEFRNGPAPSATRILEIFSDVQRHRLMSGDDIVPVFEPQITSLPARARRRLHLGDNFLIWA